MLESISSIVSHFPDIFHIIWTYFGFLDTTAKFGGKLSYVYCGSYGYAIFSPFHYYMLAGLEFHLLSDIFWYQHPATLLYYTFSHINSHTMYVPTNIKSYPSTGPSHSDMPPCIESALYPFFSSAWAAYRLRIPCSHIVITVLSFGTSKLNDE